MSAENDLGAVSVHPHPTRPHAASCAVRFVDAAREHHYTRFRGTPVVGFRSCLFAAGPFPKEKDMSSGIGLIAVILLVLANAFFVATEFAMVAVRRSRLEELVSRGDPRAKVAN